jgi:hypothetical protein
MDGDYHSQILPLFASVMGWKTHEHREVKVLASPIGQK